LEESTRHSVKQYHQSKISPKRNHFYQSVKNKTGIEMLKTLVGKPSQKNFDLTLETLMTFLRSPLGIGLIVFVVGYGIYSVRNPYSNYSDCMVYHIQNICKKI